MTTRKCMALIGVFMVVLLAFVLAAQAARYEQLNVGELSLNDVVVTATAAQLNAAGAGSVTNGTLAPLVVSNALMNVYGKNGTFTNSLTVGGAVSVPAGSITAAALAGNIDKARMTNALDTAGGVLITNTCIGAAGQTNTYIFGPVGGVYVLKSISTTP